MHDLAESRFYAALEQKLHWLKHDVLPVWSCHGVDRTGGFFERLDQSGRAIVDLPRRARVVARQTYVFATATERGWGNYQDLVVHGITGIVDRCLLDTGLSLSTYEADGTPLRTTFDAYDQAFVLFALATVARYSSGCRREETFEAGQRLLGAMREGFRHPEIGFEEAMPPRLPLLQNPHMHLLEACLAFMDVPGACKSWGEQAGELVDLAITRLADRRTGAIHEFFDADWKPIVDDQGGWIEPGHQFEWAWLLWRWHDRGDDIRASVLARQIYQIGTDHGRGVSGQVIDAINVDLVPRARTARLWPQTERLKACLSVADQSMGSERKAALEHATEALNCLDPFIKTTIPGLWYDRLDETGIPLDDDVPASTLYHIVGALDCAEQFSLRRLSGLS